MQKHYGIHVAIAMLKNRADDIETVLLSAKRQDRRLREIEQIARSRRIKIKRLPNSDLAEISEGNKHQGVIILSHFRVGETHGKSLSEWLDTLPDSNLLVALDGILDPRNLGACFRSANAAGAGGVILPRSRGCALTATVSRTAAGAVETTPIYRASNLIRTLDELKSQEYFVVGFEDDATDSVYDLDLSEKCVLVFGTEETGMRVGTRKRCDQLACIPMRGNISSLNVSVALGVVAFEAYRQRLVKQFKESRE